MIRRPEEMKTEVRHEMRGGNGDVHFLLTLEKGCSIGRHSHGPDAELFIIKSGAATVDDDGEIVKCGPGDIIYTGNGAFHSLANGGEEPLVVYALVIN